MSDEETFMSTEDEESGSDFSVSEEEYNPNDDSISSENSEAEDTMLEDDSILETSKQNKNGSKNSKTLQMRNQVFNKFKSNSMASTGIADVLARAQYQPKKSMQRNSQTSTDESSPTVEKPPVFDCSGGLNLSDSEETDDERVEKVVRQLSEVKQAEDKAKTKKMLADINKASGQQMDFAKVHDNLKQIEDAKKVLMDYNNRPAFKSTHHEIEFNIEELLMMGETSEKNLPGPSKPKSKMPGPSQSKRARAAENESDSDWEEVADQSYSIPEDGIQINIAIEGGARKTSKEIDLEACMKRKLNLARKQHQIYLHKVGLVCWISHGNYVNKIINSTTLMGLLNKLVPQQWYPKDKTNMEYFEKIAVWYKNIMALKSKEMYCKLRKKPDLIVSLALQVQSKMIICRRDFLLIFVCLLRSMGFQCRMVMSLGVDPIKPPQSELLSLSKKDDKPKTPPAKAATNSRHSTAKPSTSNSKTSTSSKNSINTSGSSKQSSSKSGTSKAKVQPLPSTPALTRSRKKEIKIPQMDGLDDEPFEKTSITETPRNATRRSMIKLPVKRSPADVEKSPNKLSDKPTKSAVQTAKSSEKSGKLKEICKTPEVRPFIAGSSILNTNSPKSTKEIRKSSRRDFSSLNISSTEIIATPLNVTERSSVMKSSPKSSTKEQPNTSKIIQKSKPNQTTEKTMSSTTLKRTVSKDPVVKSRFFLEAEPSPRRLRSRSKSNEQSTISGNTVNKESSTSEGFKSNLKRPIAKGSSAVKADSKKSKLSQEVPPTLKNTESKKKVRAVCSDSDDFLGFESSPKKSKPSTPSSVVKMKPLFPKIRDKRVLSTDVEDATESSTKIKNGIDIWCEVYSEKERRWISVDVFKGKVDCAAGLYKAASNPVAYVLAWNNDNTVKDVSARYCPQFTTATRKLRVEKEYFDSIMQKFKGPTTQRDIREDREMQQMHLDKPLPTSIGEFKNHPLYALKRHLLKFEGIYPPDAATVGFIREEAIYPRDCVFTMHSREIWVKSARVVKLNEKPYKIVTARPKWDRATNKCIKDIPLELFGIWQTKEYEPPTAENGVVPRNMYGNVELFKACMLPKKTVHLQLPGLNKVCKKLGVDCAQAVVGFDFNGGYSHPVFDGFVVCEEFVEKVQDAWNREQEEIERKAEEKFELRVYGNWKKLIKGLLIRERLKRKYNIGVLKE